MRSNPPSEKPRKIIKATPEQNEQASVLQSEVLLADSYQELTGKIQQEVWDFTCEKLAHKYIDAYAFHVLP